MQERKTEQKKKKKNRPRTQIREQNMSLRFVPGEALELGLEEALGLLRGEGVAHNQLVRALPLLLLPVPHHHPPPPLNRRNSAAAVLDFSGQNPISPR